MQNCKQRFVSRNVFCDSSWSKWKVAHWMSTACQTLTTSYFFFQNRQRDGSDWCESSRHKPAFRLLIWIQLLHQSSLENKIIDYELQKNNLKLQAFLHQVAAMIFAESLEPPSTMCACTKSCKAAGCLESRIKFITQSVWRSCQTKKSIYNNPKFHTRYMYKAPAITAFVFSML